MLYSCEKVYLTLREKRRLRVFKNRIQRRLFTNENGKRRRLHNKEHHSLYRSPNIVRATKYRRLRWTGHVARMEEGRSGFRFVTDKPTGKRPQEVLCLDGGTILEWT